jgi:hypothetical protein
MLKEAVIWAALIVSGLYSWIVFTNVLEKNEKSLFEQLIGLFFLFVALFCGIYMVFRFFHWLYIISY